MKSSMIAATILVLLSLAFIPPQSKGQDATDAKALFERKCSVCHSANRSKSTNKTNEEWTKLVARMKEKTASITNAEAGMIVDYLAKAYGK
jgi:hypothetical protein